MKCQLPANASSPTEAIAFTEPLQERVNELLASQVDISTKLNSLEVPNVDDLRAWLETQSTKRRGFPGNLSTPTSLYSRLATFIKSEVKFVTALLKLIRKQQKEIVRLSEQVQQIDQQNHSLTIALVTLNRRLLELESRSATPN